jgi:hypothetical protein
MAAVAVSRFPDGCRGHPFMTLVARLDALVLQAEASHRSVLIRMAKFQQAFVRRVPVSAGPS